MKLKFFVLFLIFGLAACGGGGGGDTDVPDYSARLESVEAMFATPGTALPTTGQLNYAGQMEVNLALPGATGAYRGDLQMAFNFDSRDTAVTGSINGFEGDDGALAGMLTISGGRIYPDADPRRDYQFEGNLSGSLSAAGDSYDAAGDIYGDFKGAEADAIIGVVAGSLRSDTDNITLFDGSFFGERE